MDFLDLLERFDYLAIFISIFANVIIAIIGILPSIFITAANVAFFGFTNGFIISIIGEALGAIISFWVYRKGLKKISQNIIEKNKYSKKIINSTGINAMKLIFSFRLFPYVPSGIVTYASAIGKVSLLEFSIASTLGKLPALFLEVLVAGTILSNSDQKIIKFIIILMSIFLIYIIIRKTNKGVK